MLINYYGKQIELRWDDARGCGWLGTEMITSTRYNRLRRAHRKIDD